MVLLCCAVNCCMQAFLLIVSEQKERTLKRHKQDINVSYLRNISYVCEMTELTQQRIVDAAIMIFNEDFSAPIEKIADKAEVTRRTLHRYFGERKDLLAACQQEMQKRCSEAVRRAFESSTDPLIQLEQMLYACVDCGTKYAFLYKLHNQPGHQHHHEDEDCADYDCTFGKIRFAVRALQEKGVMGRELTIEWVLILFTGMVSSTINAAVSGTVAMASIKTFAWYSFSKGVGI